MTQFFRILSFVFLVVGLLLGGVLGTETRLLLFWPSLVGIGLAGVFAILSRSWKMQSAPSQVLMGLMILCSGYLLVRSIFSPVAEYAREDYLMIAASVVVYFLTATVFSSRRYRLWILGVTGVILVGNIVLGIIQYEGAWGFHILPSFERSFGDGQRIGGFYNNANHLGTFLIMSGAMFITALFLLKSKLVWRSICMLLGVLSVVALILTVSRGAILAGLGAALVGLVILLYLWKKTEPVHFWKSVLFGGVLLLVLSGAWLGPFLQHMGQRMETAGMTRFVEGDPRSEIWNAALIQWKTQPLFGVGSRMFYDGCIEFRTPETPQIGEALFVHNDWLQLLTEYGIVGFCLVLLVVAAHFWHGVQYLRWFVTERYLKVGYMNGTLLSTSVGAFVGLVAIGIHAVVEFPLHVPSLALLTAVFLGFLCNPGRVAASTAPRKVLGMRWMVRGMIFFCSTGILWSTWRHAEADWMYDQASRYSLEDQDANLAQMLLLSQVLEKDPSVSAAYHDRGQLRFAMGSEMPPEIARTFLLKAEADVREAIRLKPKHFYYYLTLGDICDAQGEHDEAYQAFEKAVELAPLYEAPRVGFAQHYQRQGMWEEAEYAYLWAREANAVGSFIWFPHYEALLNFLGNQIDAKLQSQPQN